MRYRLVISKQFDKAYKKFAGKNALLRNAIVKSLKKLAEDPYNIR